MILQFLVNFTLFWLFLDFECRWVLPYVEMTYLVGFFAVDIVFHIFFKWDVDTGKLQDFLKKNKKNKGKHWNLKCPVQTCIFKKKKKTVWLAQLLCILFNSLFIFYFIYCFNDTELGFICNESLSFSHNKIFVDFQFNVTLIYLLVS